MTVSWLRKLCHSLRSLCLEPATLQGAGCFYSPNALSNQLKYSTLHPLPTHTPTSTHTHCTPTHTHHTPTHPHTHTHIYQFFSGYKMFHSNHDNQPRSNEYHTVQQFTCHLRMPWYFNLTAVSCHSKVFSFEIDWCCLMSCIAHWKTCMLRPILHRNCCL